MTTHLRVALRLVILAILLTQPNQSFAQDDGRWVRKLVRSSCQFWENCPRYRYKWKYVRHYQIRNVYRDRYNSERARVPSFCPDKYVTKVGEERYGRDRAKEAAAMAWSEEVRNQCGVLWMGVGNSRDGTYECVESATGNRNSEKTAGAAGQVLVQCVIRAKPGRAKLEPVNGE